MPVGEAGYSGLEPPRHISARVRDEPGRGKEIFMTNNKITTKQDAAPESWGSRSELVAIANRLRTMLPGGEKLTTEQALALAQYSQLADANPFRGELYAMTNYKGEVTFVEGYKLLVRWAKQKCGYIETYQEISEDAKARMGLNPKEDTAFTCFILRDDQKGTLREFVDLGFTAQEAFDKVASSATGVVTKKDRVGKKGPIPPPKGWTWHDVAKKRALKNALNISHGAPSPRELAQASWQVGNISTLPQDWQQTPDHIAKNQEMVERYAAMQAREREQLENDAEMTTAHRKERMAENVTILRGSDDDYQIGDDDAGLESDLPESPPEFTTLEDLLYQINQDFGLSESDAKATLKDHGYTTFSPTKSADMYDVLRPKPIPEDELPF